MAPTSSEAEFATADSGQSFFSALFGCLVFANCLFVPFAAFLSLSSEWDEETLDMLVMSNLRPWQIVRGKFLSAGFQALLYAVTFLPFLAFGISHLRLARKRRNRRAVADAERLGSGASQLMLGSWKL